MTTRVAGFAAFRLRVMLVFATAAAIVLLLMGCGGSNDGETDGAAGTPAPGATAGASPGDGPGVVTPTPGGPVELINIVCPPQDDFEDDGYCELIDEIRAELDRGEAPRILRQLMGRMVQCPAAGAACAGAEGSIEVIQLTRNDGGTEVRLPEARRLVDELLDGIDAEASDARGAGELSLFAIATGMTETRDKAVAFTGIAEGAESGRFVLMAIIAGDEDGWFVGGLNVVEGERSEPFLAEVERRQSAGSFWKWQLTSTIEQTAE